MTLETILEENRSIRSLATSLNQRAGSQVFPVMSETELQIWMRNALNGARSRTEIKNLNALRLPDLNPALVAKVKADNPDTILVLGIPTPVDYSETVPRVRLDTVSVASNAWRNLPDSGIILPGGRFVKVIIPFNWRENIGDTDMVSLKNQCTHRVNKEQWDMWLQLPSTSRPTIALPDMTASEPIFPEIIEASYGTSVVDRSALKAYGTAAYNSERYWPNDPWLKIAWFPTRSEAISARTEATNKIRLHREEVLEQGRRAVAQTAAEKTQRLLQNLRDRNGWYELETSLRALLSERMYEHLGSSMTVKALQIWNITTQALLQQAEAALMTIEEQKKLEDAEVAKIQRVISVDDETARRMNAFCIRGMEIAGSLEALQCIMEHEAKQEYGRARRVGSLAEKLPGIDLTGLDWTVGQDVVHLNKWLAHLNNPTARKPQTSNTPPSLDLSRLQSRFNRRK